MLWNVERSYEGAKRYRHRRDPKSNEITNTKPNTVKTVSFCTSISSSLTSIHNMKIHFYPFCVTSIN